MMICHLRNVDVERLVQEALVLFEVCLTQQHVVVGVYHEIFDMTVNFNNWHGCVVHVVDRADPLILNFILQLEVYLREHRFRIVHIHDLTGTIRSYYDQIDVRPWKAKLSCMRSIYSDLTLRYSFFNHSGNVFNNLFLHWLHIRENFFDRVAELKNFKMKLVVHIILVLNAHFLLDQHHIIVILSLSLRDHLLKSFHHIN